VRASSRRICVVDDDDGVRNSVRRLLEAYDFETTGYASGADFLSHHRRGKLGCLILDMNLPGLSGLDILMQIRGVANEDIPVIMITGQGDRLLRERLLAAGASAYLEKPFKVETLVETLEGLLGG
jgi:two-component system, LuxR family, response regulator FixJ